MTRNQVNKMVRAIRERAGSTIFSCKFIKRTTGEERQMVCRLNVTKGVTGKGLAFDPAEHALLTVFDVQANGFRSIPLDGIISIKIRGDVVTGAKA